VLYIAACAAVANAVAVTCTNNFDSVAVQCSAGYYLNSGNCTGVCFGK
jgi:hypothetical protein